MKPEVSRPALTKKIESPAIRTTAASTNFSRATNDKGGTSSSTSKTSVRTALPDDDLQFNAFDQEDLDWGTEEAAREPVPAQRDPPLAPAYRYLGEFTKWSSENRSEW